MTAATAGGRDQTNTLYGLLSTRAKALRDQPFVRLGDSTWSYDKLHRQSMVCARGFIELGCKPTARIGMLVENRLEFLSAWFGTAYAGAVHVPLNLEYKGDILRHVLEDITVEIMVCEDYLLPNLLGAMDGARHGIRKIIVFGKVEGKTVPGVEMIGWDAFQEMAQAAPEHLPVQRSPGALGIVMLTSGTTGVSKGVMCSDKHAITHGREAAEAYGISSSDVMYTCLPLFHGNAGWATVLCAMSACASVAISKRFSASKFWPDVIEMGATQVAFLGTMLHILTSAPPHEWEREHKVRIGTSVPCPPDVMIAFERRFGFPLLETYGNTETKRILSNRHYLRRIGSAGIATPSSIVEVHDAEGWQVPPGTVGELCYRPKEPGILTLGYLNRPEATLANLRDGWWCTGDLAWQDADGFVYFSGRKKDALRRRGENVSAYEVERALEMHGGVQLAAVVAAPSQLSEDEIVAVIVRKPGATPEPAEIFAHADKSLPSFMVPRFIAFVDELPETATGKISKDGLGARVMLGEVWDSEKAGLTASRAFKR
jgi:crotonobetaine/carnitine-CoA ligase